MANYRKIWSEKNGPIPKDEFGRSYEIHHIDGNRSNNSLDNLQCLSIQEHYNIHYNKGDYSAAAAISIRMENTKNLSGYKQDPEHSKKIAEALQGKSQAKQKCPYCGKLGGNTMNRWHFDNCLSKPGNENKKHISTRNKEQNRLQSIRMKNNKINLGRKLSQERIDKLKSLVPWNKGLKGVQIPWNKGLKMSTRK
jgi:hypothetical protein